MNPSESRPNPLRAYFEEALGETLEVRLGLRETAGVRAYLAAMLADFLHQDAIFRIRDARGQRLERLAELLLEGDVRFNADSFEREREVHRHIGDLLMFWSGLFPESVGMVADDPDKALAQGQESYFIASTFDYPPHTEEARVLARLSNDFSAFRYGLMLVRRDFKGFEA